MKLHVVYLVAASVLCFGQVLGASLLHARAWTPSGLLLAFGNREAMPEPTPLVGRAKRAGANMVENLVLFAVLMLAASLGGAPADKLDLGAAIFFWARVAHVGFYLAGVAGLRTLAWAVSLVGLGVLGMAALGV